VARVACYRRGAGVSCAGFKMRVPLRMVRPPVVNPRTGCAFRNASVTFATVLFAVWTVLCHLTMLLGQNLYFLLAAAAVSMGALGFLLARARGTRAWPEYLRFLAGEDLTLAPVRRVAPTMRREVGIATLGVVAISLAYWFTRDGILLVGLLSLLLLALAVSDEYPRLQSLPVRPRRTAEMSHGLLAALCAFVTAWVHRSSSDDTFYVNTAVAVADHPEMAILKYNTMIGVPDTLIHAPFYKVHTFEVLAGAISYLTGLSGLAVSHLLLPVVCALLVPPALSVMATTIAGKRWPLVVWFVVAFFLVEGSAYAGFSNHAIVRLQHGKSVLMAAGLPVLIGYTLRFMVQPSVRGAVLMTAAGIACLGLTSSSLMLVPLVVGLAALTMWRPTLVSTRALVVAALSTLYTIGIALYVRHLATTPAWNVESTIAAVVEVAKAKVTSEPNHTEIALSIMFGGFPAQVALVAAMMMAVVVMQRGSVARRFATLYLLVFLLVAFNPLWADFVRRTISPIYCRVLWGLPVPMLIAVGFASLVRGTGNPRRWQSSLALTLAGYAAFLWQVPEVYALERRNGVRVHAPSYKVPEVFEVSAWVNRLVPEGSFVLAPDQVSFWMTTMNHHAYPLTTKPGYLDSVMPPEESGRRAALSQFVAWGAVEGRFLKQMHHRSSQFLPELERALSEYRLGAVCLAPWNRMLVDIRTVLKKNQFKVKQVVDGFEIWVRSDLVQYYQGQTVTTLPVVPAPGSAGSSSGGAHAGAHSAGAGSVGRGGAPGRTP
jgi:hypothetical protein